MVKKLAALIALLAMPILCLALDSSFSLTDTTGRQHSLKEHRGKWVLINLWATWCHPCLAEMPELDALSRSREDLVVVGLAVDGQNVRRITQFTEKLRVTYPIVAGNEELVALFKPRGYPTTILFDASGKQIYLKEGPVTRQEIEAVLQQKSVK